MAHTVWRATLHPQCAAALASILACAAAASAQPGCPQLTTQPAPVATCATPNPTLTVAASGDPALAYQWQVQSADDWFDIPEGGDVLVVCDVVSVREFWAHSQGSTTPQLTVTDIIPHGAGGFCPGSVSFRCVVSNTCGAVPSTPAAVSICLIDLDCNGHVQPADLATFVARWFTSLQQGTLAGDFDHSGAIEPADIASFVGAWFNAIASNGC